MTDTEKLDKIIGLLEASLEKQQDLEEQIAELRESMHDREASGSGLLYGFDVTED